MRHGQSQANVKQLIVSSPENGLSGYGLTDQGKIQAAKAVKHFPELDEDVRIFSSDFLRTKQTAEIVGTQLEITHPVVHTPFLRERFFGSLELGPDTYYENVWANDLIAPKTPGYGAEPVESVLKRTLDCVRQIEEHLTDKKVLLVSHGDTLQIFLTHLKVWPPMRHREIKHLDVARIRKAYP